MTDPTHGQDGQGRAYVPSLYDGEPPAYFAAPDPEPAGLPGDGNG